MSARRSKIEAPKVLKKVKKVKVARAKTSVVEPKPPAAAKGRVRSYARKRSKTASAKISVPRTSKKKASSPVKSRSRYTRSRTKSIPMEPKKRPKSARASAAPKISACHLSKPAQKQRRRSSPAKAVVKAMNGVQFDAVVSEDVSKLKSKKALLSENKDLRKRLFDADMELKALRERFAQTQRLLDCTEPLCEIINLAVDQMECKDKLIEILNKNLAETCDSEEKADS